MFDIAAVGEILIDFTPSGKNEAGMPLFSCNPGGAPANVLVMNEKLGGNNAFIGKAGSDPFGRFLENCLKSNRIDVSGMVFSKDVPTTLAFVHLDQRGDRTFSFYRKNGADISLKPSEIKESIVKNCKVFHFGSVSLTDEPSRTATLTSVLAAKKSGAVISFDPNYRPNLWEDRQSAVEEISRALTFADIVKLSEEEMTLLTGKKDWEKGTEILLQAGASLAVVTMGPKGAFYRSTGVCGYVPTFDVPTIDTTGAGDAFCGALLRCLRDKTIREIRDMPREELERDVIFANAAGCLATTKKGAMPAMPTLEEIQNCIRTAARFPTTIPEEG